MPERTLPVNADRDHPLIKAMLADGRLRVRDGKLVLCWVEDSGDKNVERQR